MVQAIKNQFMSTYWMLLQMVSKYKTRGNKLVVDLKSELHGRRLPINAKGMRELGMYTYHEKIYSYPHLAYNHRPEAFHL